MSALPLSSVNTVLDAPLDTDLESQLGELLAELSAVQDDLLGVLAEKRQRLAAPETFPLDDVNQREAELAARLERCHARREELLATAQQQGMPVQSLGNLAAVLQPGNRAGLGRQVRMASTRMQLLQHQSLTNWVLAQRSLLHLSQMLEIIASGGRLQPTYGRSDASSRGALVDSQA